MGKMTLGTAAAVLIQAELESFKSTQPRSRGETRLQVVLNSSISNTQSKYFLQHNAVKAHKYPKSTAGIGWNS